MFVYSMMLVPGDSLYTPVGRATMGMQFNETAKSMRIPWRVMLLLCRRWRGTVVPLWQCMSLRKVVDAREVTALRGNRKVSVCIPEEMMQKLMTDSGWLRLYRFPRL